MKPNVILYHRHCRDGFGGAWAAWKKIGSAADYIGVNHQEKPPVGLKNRHIYLIDFSYPITIVKRLLKTAKSLTIIDHHLSAAPVAKIIPNRSYDNSHSGAVLAWRYFHPQKPVPQLLLYIEDIDLWKFRLSFTKELIASLDTYDFNFNVWNKLAAAWQSRKSIKKHINEGKIILRYQNRIIKEVAEYAEKIKFQNHIAFAVNSPILLSELGHFLYRKKPPLGIVWYKKNHRIDVSLRSNGKVDVSKLAAKFGGGGHKAASGFRWPEEKPMPWTPLKN